MRTSTYLVALLAAVTSAVPHYGSDHSSSDKSPLITDRLRHLKAEKCGTTTGSLCGCKLLSLLSPANVHFPGSATYTSEQASYWSATARLAPRCIFTPSTAKEVSAGVQVATICKSEFAMRGGGHMPVVGASSSEGGILFGLTKLNQIALSPQGKSVHVGPGNRWGAVYTYLAKTGLYSLGGRLSTVGVPGLLLGGGINFFTNKYGFAMDNVVSFEVVLADGRIVVATGSNQYKDLFWALKGGSGQFGIVTDFELKTYKIPKVWSGMSLFGAAPTDPVFDKFLSAISNFANSGYTRKGAGIITQMQYISQGPDAPPFVGGFAALMHEGTEKSPAIFKEFDQIPWLKEIGSGLPLGIPYNVTDPVYLSDAMASQQEPVDRHTFHVQSSLATPGALKIVHSTFFGLLPKLLASVPSTSLAGATMQPIPCSAIAVGKSDPANLKGNSFGLKQGENQFWYDIVVSWGNPAEDAAAEAWTTELGNTLVAAFKKEGLMTNDGRGFQYLNDAQGNQDVFATYGPKELKKLRQIREKYDAHGKVFGKKGLAKGGFKF